MKNTILFQKPCCHVLVLVVIRELVHVLDNLVDAHPEEVSDRSKHPTSHLAERLPCPGASKLIKTGLHHSYSYLASPPGI